MPVNEMTLKVSRDRRDAEQSYVVITSTTPGNHFVRHRCIVNVPGQGVIDFEIREWEASPLPTWDNVERVM